MINLEKLAHLTSCQLVGKGDHLISGVADLESATSEDASFFSNPKYLQAMLRSNAGVIFVDAKASLKEGKNYLLSDQPSQAFQILIDFLHPSRSQPSGFTGIHPSSVIHTTAKLAEGVTVGPHVVIDENAQIGANTFLGAGTYVGPKTIIGHSCMIHPKVVIRESCIIGNHVIIQPGAVIGACGFGYITNKQGKHEKLNQVGIVIIEDDVEIGANTTIDRARFKCTKVGKGSKIDNLVQLGHGVTIGTHNIVAAQTGFAGSTSTDSYATFAGQVAVAGHLKLGQVTITGKSGVTKSLPAGQYGGIPAFPLQEHNRNQVYLRNIEQYITEIKKLAKRIELLEKKVQD